MSRKLLDRMRRDPELFKELDKGQAIRQKAAANMSRDLQYADKTGLPIRQDVINAYKAVVDGGLTGLQKALDSGAILPAAVATVLGLLVPQLQQETPDDA